MRKKSKKSHYLNFLKVYLFREKVCVCVCASGGGTERGKERIPSRLCTVSMEPDVGLYS